MPYSIKELLSSRSREEIMATLDYFNALPSRQGRKEDLVRKLCSFLSKDPKIWLRQLMECDLRMLQKLCHAGPDNVIELIPADFPTVIEVLRFVEANKINGGDMLRVSIPAPFYELIAADIDQVISEKEQDGSFRIEHLILGAVNVFGVVPLRTFVENVVPDIPDFELLHSYARSIATHPIMRIYQEDYMGESYMVSPDVENFESIMKDRRKKFKSVRRYARIDKTIAEECGENSPFCAFGRSSAEGIALYKMLESLGYVGEELLYTAHLVWINSQYEPDQHNLEILLSPVTDAVQDIESYDQFVEYAQVILNYANAAPKWLLKGHSANETGLMRYEMPSGMYLELFDEDQAAEEAEQVMRIFDSVNKVRPVGPDDPCPCGSGLSYRFCHGRHVS